jgi:hypothetical protein
LAFLEAQCWKKELGGLRQSVPAANPADIAATASQEFKVVRPIKRKSSPLGLPGTLAAMAACFLLALGAGRLWQIADNRNAGVFGSGGANQFAGNNPGQTAINPPNSQTAVAQAANPADNSGASWQWVKLSPPGTTDTAESIQLPALQSDHIDQQWLQSVAPKLPEDVLQALKLQGYEVLTQQRLMPMPLKDGRQLVVPVDQYELKYIGNQTY